MDPSGNELMNLWAREILTYIVPLLSTRWDMISTLR